MINYNKKLRSQLNLPDHEFGQILPLMVVGIALSWKAQAYNLQGCPAWTDFTCCCQQTLLWKYLYLKLSTHIVTKLLFQLCYFYFQPNV